MHSISAGYLWNWRWSLCPPPGLGTACTALQEACLQDRGPSSPSQPKPRRLSLAAPTFQTNFWVGLQLWLDFFFLFEKYFKPLLGKGWRGGKRIIKERVKGRLSAWLELALPTAWSLVVVELPRRGERLWAPYKHFVGLLVKQGTCILSR